MVCIFSAGVDTQIYFLNNITKDVEFSHMIRRRWEEFQHYAQHPDVSSSSTVSSSGATLRQEMAGGGGDPALTESDNQR